MFNNQKLHSWFFEKFLNKTTRERRLSQQQQQQQKNNKENKEKKNEIELEKEDNNNNNNNNNDDMPKQHKIGSSKDNLTHNNDLRNNSIEIQDKEDSKFNDELNDNNINNINNNNNNNNDNSYFDGPSNIHFHASLFDFLTKDISVQEIMGVHIVSRIKGETRETFNSIDTDGNGIIDKNELKHVLFKLGEKVNEKDITECFNEIDTDGNGEISYQEFESWYIKSSMRITTDVKKIFHQFDDNNDGHIDCDELKTLLQAMNDDNDNEISDEQVKIAMNELGKKTLNDKISENEFIEWYQSTTYFEKKQLRRQATVSTIEEAEENDEGIDISFPKGLFPRIMFIITSPIMYTLHYTLADVQKESKKKYWLWTFCGSMLWLMMYSYLMVWFATRVGQSWNVPDEVMGLTFLAAGTSVPDLLSSVIVAKMGEGDMAVSSSIGSNIFDILIGLPIPWLLFTISIGNGKIGVYSKSLFLSVVILIIMLGLVLLVIKFNKWKLTHQLGWTMFILWILFVTQDLIRQFCTKCNP